MHKHNWNTQQNNVGFLFRTATLKIYHVKNNYQIRDDGWAVDAGRFHKLEEVHQPFWLHLLEQGMDAEEGASATHTVTAEENMNSIKWPW